MSFNINYTEFLRNIFVVIYNRYFLPEIECEPRLPNL